MTESVPVVDLFSGPGGLAEGFAALKGPDGRPRFNVALSIEMEPTAHRTLRLRGFLRKFLSGFPPEYYDFLNGDVAQEPDWAAIYPHEWREACDETRCLKLGTSEATSFVRKRIAKIRAAHGDRTVLLGGPPCQSYSVAGRARNVGNADYDPAKDERQSLYLEYAKVLAQLQPAVAVMENVRGMLSARHGGGPDVERIAASWAERNGVHQIVCKPDWNKHGRAAPFRRNDELLNLLPKGVIAFPGSGITDNLVDKARQLGSSVQRCIA